MISCGRLLTPVIITGLKRSSTANYDTHMHDMIQRNDRLYCRPRHRPRCASNASPRGGALVLLPDAGYPATSSLLTTAPRPAAVLQAKGLVKSRD